MKTILASMTVIAFAATSAGACEFMKSAEYKTMSVASLEETETPMSTAHSAVTEEVKVDELTTGAIEDTESETAE
ncbi:MAG: hypothetical protein AB3N20_00630 [Rhizobiaceae bacterium]